MSYAVRVRWADGSVSDEILGATSGRLPDNVAKVTDGRTEIGMWRFPFDPSLPGLSVAYDPVRMRKLATRAGLGDGGTVRLRAYRPRRRAVIEVATERGSLFVKVVRPGKARDLHDRHRAATAAGCPVPAPIGWSEDGRGGRRPGISPR